LGNDERANRQQKHSEAGHALQALPGIAGWVAIDGR
jgi:hypothetical protein